MTGEWDESVYCRRMRRRVLSRNSNVMYTFDSPQKTHQFGSSIIAQQHFPQFLGYLPSSQSTSQPSQLCKWIKVLNCKFLKEFNSPTLKRSSLPFFFKVRQGIIIQGFESGRGYPGRLSVSQTSQIRLQKEKPRRNPLDTKCFNYPPGKSATAYTRNINRRKMSLKTVKSST